jgi:hypothetical protein
MLGLLMDAPPSPATLYIAMSLSRSLREAPFGFRVWVKLRHCGGKFCHVTGLIQLALIRERHATDVTAAARLRQSGIKAITI